MYRNFKICGFLEEKGKIFWYICCPAAIGTTVSAKFVVKSKVRKSVLRKILLSCQIPKSKENINPKESGWS